jgi:Fe-only nitrogenase accessory protein AnfO
MKIAVLVDTNGQTISFNEGGKVRLYLKENTGWQIIYEIPFQLDGDGGTRAVRDSIRSMVESLRQCRIFVASEIKGLPYTTLEGMNFNIWKADGRPEEFLDYIFDKENQDKFEKSESYEIPTPVETSPGKYFIDLKDIMENNEVITSKQVLLPFFRNNEFEELKVICTHIPPWLKVELPKLNLNVQVEGANEGEFKIIISHAN